MNDLEVIPWPYEAAPSEERIAEICRQDGLAPYRWSNGPGDTYAPHKHSYHKVIYVLEGSIVFDLPATGESHGLGAGDRLDLPAGVVHAARVGPQGVVCLEGHRD